MGGRGGAMFSFFLCVCACECVSVPVCGVYREESDLHYIAHHSAKTLKACGIKRTGVSKAGGRSLIRKEES